VVLAKAMVTHVLHRPVSVARFVLGRVTSPQTYGWQVVNDDPMRLAKVKEVHRLPFK
jgi:hypothetical protein